MSPPGCVDVEFVPGATEKVIALGPLTTTIPEPPAPALGGEGLPPSPPVPVFAPPEVPGPELYIAPVPPPA